MIRILLLAFCLLASCGISHGQTKLISHKSHSGKSSTFGKAYNHRLFDIDASNFGEAPRRFVRNAMLDSVIFLTDTTAIMITSEVCITSEWNGTYPDTNVWKAGRDTLLNHPLFSQQHKLNKIKRTLDKKYHFQNKASSTVFIGYDNTPIPPSQPEPQVPPSNTPNDMPSNYPEGGTQESQKIDKSIPQTSKRKAKRKRQNKRKRIFTEQPTEAPEKTQASKQAGYMVWYGVLGTGVFLLSFLWFKIKV